MPAWTSAFRTWEENGEVHFERSWIAAVAGANLNDAERDALPSTTDDPRVWDQDGDGKPGVTVHVRSPLGNGDVYIVKRFRNQYTGVITADHRLHGVVQDAAGEQVIGASNRQIQLNLPTHQNPDLNESPVAMVKIADGYDCDRLMAEKDSLFP